jgi:hypothetical protein
MPAVTLQCRFNLRVERSVCHKIVNMNNFISSSWWMSEAGYELHGSGSRALIRERRGGRYRFTNPSDEQWLFRDFAAIESGDHAVAFASKHGLLGIPVRGETTACGLVRVPRAVQYLSASRRARSEPLMAWLGEAALLSMALAEWDVALRPGVFDRPDQLMNGGLLLFACGMLTGRVAFDLPAPLGVEVWHDEDTGGDDPGADALTSLMHSVNAKLRELPINPVLQRNGKKGVKLVLQPLTLLGTIWVQFAQAITGIATLRGCAYCGKPIEIGWSSDPREQGKRTHRKTCSQSCRTALWRDRKNRSTVCDTGD